jgi:hypothetical protein
MERKQFQDFIWVWQVDKIQNLEEKVKKLSDAGWAFAVKYHDGDPYDDGPYFTKNFENFILRTKPKTPVYTWGYVYGNKFGRLKQEIQGMKTALDRSDGYIIDAEIEWEVADGNSWAKAFTESLKDIEKPVAVSPFWNMRYHRGYPIRPFQDAGIVVMPQVYFGLAKRVTEQAQREMFQITLEDFGICSPVASYPDLEGCLNLFKMAQDENCPCVSVWSLDKLTDVAVDALCAYNHVWQKGVVPTGNENAIKVYNTLKEIQTLLK